MKEAEDVRTAVLLLEQPKGTCELSLQVVRRNDTLEFYPMSVTAIAGSPSLEVTPSQIIHALRMHDWTAEHRLVFTECRTVVDA